MLGNVLRSGVPLLILLMLVGCGGENLFPTLPGASRADLTGTINGQVTAAGTPMGGVEIALAGGSSVSTDSFGRFRFENLPAGVHSVSIRVPAGFILDAGEEAVRNVTVAAGGTATVNWRLRPAEGAGGQPGQGF